MKKNFSIQALLAAMVITIAIPSCSKSSEGDSDRENPVVSLNSPSDEQVFTGAQTISISGTVTDNRYIREIHIEISDFDTGQEYLHVHIHPASASHTYNQPYLLATNKNYKIRVIADDAQSNSTVKTVHISCIP